MLSTKHCREQRDQFADPFGVTYGTSPDKNQDGIRGGGKADNVGWCCLRGVGKSSDAFALFDALIEKSLPRFSRGKNRAEAGGNYKCVDLLIADKDYEISAPDGTREFRRGLRPGFGRGEP
ncbi:MAG: hypothetical protein H0U64_06770 [Gemmatimonadaceae bacterium]|nr:hypothetical protein [Gemmatimonadaceae bacterium]